MIEYFKKRPARIFVPLLLALLALKYGYTLVRFPDVPIGYDAGIYRFLFTRLADGFPPFSIPDIPPWAKAHALGLFFFSSLLIKLGVSSTLLTGFLWNIFQVALFSVVAFVQSRRRGVTVGILTLFSALLSVSQYEGFLLMYWKVMCALLFCTLAFDAHERRSWLIVLWGMFTIAVHQQIGLIYGLAMLGTLFIGFLRQERHMRVSLGWFALSLLLGLLWYVPNYQFAIHDVLLQAMTVDTALAIGMILLVLGCVMLAFVLAPKHRRLMLTVIGVACAVPIMLLPFTSIAPGIFDQVFRGVTQGYPGIFLSGMAYLQTSWPLLLFGTLGFFISLKKERGSADQCAALISALGVISMLFFYRRFILPFDFFLLPFVALGILFLWRRKNVALRFGVLVLLLVQLVFVLKHMQSVDPGISIHDLTELRLVDEKVQPGDIVVSLDTLTPWVTGMMTDAYVVGPGIFDSQSYEAWENFLFGTSAERKRFIEYYPSGTHFYASRLFYEFYPPEVPAALFRDSCFVSENVTGLYRSICGRLESPLP